MARIPVCEVTALAVDEKKVFRVGDDKVLLYHLEDGFFATQAGCTHIWLPLERGHLKDGCITCFAHRARFDVRTGEVLEWANFPPGVQLLNGVRKPTPLKTWPVVVEDDTVYIET